MSLETKTKTFAEIYESQGHYKDAISIYIDILKDNPLDCTAIDNIKRLQALINEEGDIKKKVADIQIAALDDFMQKVHAYKSASNS